MRNHLETLRRLPGVRAAVVSTREGVAACAEGSEGTDVEAIAALASRFLSHAESAFGEARAGRVRRARLRGSEGRILLSAWEDAFLAVVVDRRGGVEVEQGFEMAVERLAEARRVAVC